MVAPALIAALAGFDSLGGGGKAGGGGSPGVGGGVTDTTKQDQKTTVSLANTQGNVSTGGGGSVNMLLIGAGVVLLGVVAWQFFKARRGA